MVQSWQTMHPGHSEHNLWGIAPLAMLEMPETWQDAVNHWLDVALTFSGLSLGLGYGVLVLALSLLLLPTAFPELSRPRDVLWSLPLAALAPLLLLNRLPVFSSAGLGELIATVLMARLAAEVGQGRWESLAPDQKEALRHLPRWRSAGADLVAAVVQAAKAIWGATVRAGKAVRGGDQHGGTSPGVPDAPPSMEASSDPAADNAPDEDAATGGSGEATSEQEHRAGTGLVAAVVQAGKSAWGAVSGQKVPVEQRQQRWSAQKLARKEWVRPDPSDEAQGDQDGEKTNPGIPDVTPAMGTSPGPTVDNAPDAEPPQPVDGDDDDQGAEDAEANVEDAATDLGGDATWEKEHLDKPTDGLVVASLEEATPEEHSTPESAEEAQLNGDDLGGDKGADAVGPEPEPGESSPEGPSIPEPVEEAQPLGGTDHPKASQVDAGFQDVDNSAPVDVALEGDSGDVAAAGEGGEGLVTAEAAAGGPQEVTDTPEAETEPAQSTGDGPTQSDQDGKDLVVSSFDEVDAELRESS